jgi:hypothetical protein
VDAFQPARAAGTRDGTQRTTGLHLFYERGDWLPCGADLAAHARARCRRLAQLRCVRRVHGAFLVWRAGRNRRSRAHGGQWHGRALRFPASLRLARRDDCRQRDDHHEQRGDPRGRARTHSTVQPVLRQSHDSALRRGHARALEQTSRGRGWWSRQPTSALCAFCRNPQGLVHRIPAAQEGARPCSSARPTRLGAGSDGSHALCFGRPAREPAHAAGRVRRGDADPNRLPASPTTRTSSAAARWAQSSLRAALYRRQNARGTEGFR